MIFVEYTVFFGLLLVGVVFYVLDMRRSKVQKLPFSLYVRESKKCQSSIESKLFNALWNRNHYVVTQLKAGKYRMDLALPQYRICVEADGEIWHYANEEQILRDKKRDAYLRSKGWEVLRFPGKQIQKDVMSCVWKVEEEIQRKALHS